MALLPDKPGNGAPPAATGERVPPTQPGEAGGAPPTEQGGEAPPMNNLALNGIRMLYDEKAFPGFVDMIKGGDDGAAQVALTIGEKIFRDLKKRNKPIDDEAFMEGAETIIGEVIDIAERVGAEVNPDKVMFLAMSRFIERNGNDMDLEGMQQSLSQVSPEDMQAATGIAEQVGELPNGAIAQRPG